MQHWPPPAVQREPDECDTGGADFDSMLNETAKSQPDNKPLRHLQFDRQRQPQQVPVLPMSCAGTPLLTCTWPIQSQHILCRVQEPVGATSNEAEADSRWPIKPDEDYVL